MKKKLLLALAILGLLVGLFACDAVDVDVLPVTDDTYDVGSDSLRWAEGYFVDLDAAGDVGIEGALSISGNLTLEDSVILEGDGLVWLEFRPDLDFESVRANGAPTWVTRGVFGGFSLPVGGANELLQLEMYTPLRWSEPAWQRLGVIGTEPGGMEVYEDKLYIPCEQDDNVWVYDGSDFSISGSVGIAPLYACEYEGNLYVSCSGDDTIWVFNGTIWAKSGDIGESPIGMAEFDGNLYVACETDDEVWIFNGTVWALDAAVGDHPLYLAEYGGNLYLSCAGGDDDIWVRNGAWAAGDAVDDQPQEFHEFDGNLYLTCENNDTVWIKVGAAAWTVTTNVLTDIGNSPIGIEEYNNSLYVACKDEIWANLSDFWNLNSDFDNSGFEDDEPMFLKEYDNKLYLSCKTSDSIWVYSGETTWVHITCWIGAAQTVPMDAFRLQIEHESFTPNTGIVPSSSHDVVVEALTGVASKYQSYEVAFPIDMTGMEGSDPLGFELYRITSSDEIVGEVIIQHAGVIFKCNKMGSPAP